MNSQEEATLNRPEQPPTPIFNHLQQWGGYGVSPIPISQSEIAQISPAALAYIGDAIYELYVRMYYLLPRQRTASYHRLVVAQVKAETQASHMRSLIPHLQPPELEIVRRGRNAAGQHKRTNPQTYQQATSLETLIGYLYLTDHQRLTELLQKLNLEPLQ